MSSHACREKPSPFRRRSDHCEQVVSYCRIVFADYFRWMVHAASIPKAAGYHSLWRIKEPQLRSAGGRRNGGSRGAGVRRPSAEWGATGGRIVPQRKIVVL